MQVGPRKEAEAVENRAGGPARDLAREGEVREPEPKAHRCGREKTKVLVGNAPGIEALEQLTRSPGIEVHEGHAIVPCSRVPDGKVGGDVGVDGRERHVATGIDGHVVRRLAAPCRDPIAGSGTVLGTDLPEHLTEFGLESSGCASGAAAALEGCHFGGGGIFVVLFVLRA